ncbi:MAG TPA: hypothetical protein VFP42_04550 [Acidimicrobiia bacterium]|nr:hypothetical protein [Acidimicrobiia bacterium]
MKSNKLVAVLPWVLLGVLVVSWGMAAWLDQWSDEVTRAIDKVWALSFFAFPVVGVFLARRIPTNAVGWLFIVGPLLVGSGVALQELSEARDLPGIVTASEVVFDAGLLTLFSSLTLFPDGRYGSRWWVFAHIATVIVTSLLGGGFLALVVFLGLFPLIYRLIRGDATIRRQIAGPFVVILIGVVSLVLVNIFVTDAPTLAQTALTGITMLFTIGVPVSIAIAITRYRLYEMDRLLSRTVSYVVVIALLGTVYFVGLSGLTLILPGESSLAVAGSTLAVAALFNPLRRTVQGMVDHRFNRSRYDAERVMSGFTGSLRDEVDPERVVGGWVSVVAETMQPAAAGVWVKER